MFSSTSLTHSVILLHLTLIASDKMSGDVLRRLDLIVCRCAAPPAQDVLRIIASTSMTYNAINCQFVQRISEFFYCRLSFPIVDFVASISTGSSGMYFICRSVSLASGASVVQSIQTVYPNLSLLTLIVLDDTSFTRNSPFLGGISLLYDPFIRGSATDIVIGGRSSWMYCRW